jgi:hypothetical protein
MKTPANAIIPSGNILLIIGRHFQIIIFGYGVLLLGFLIGREVLALGFARVLHLVRHGTLPPLVAGLPSK